MRVQWGGAEWLNCFRKGMELIGVECVIHHVFEEVMQLDHSN